MHDPETGGIRLELMTQGEPGTGELDSCVIRRSGSISVKVNFTFPVLPVTVPLSPVWGGDGKEAALLRGSSTSQSSAVTWRFQTECAEAVVLVA